MLDPMGGIQSKHRRDPIFPRFDRTTIRIVVACAQGGKTSVKTNQPDGT